jgi:hypothetical protein
MAKFFDKVGFGTTTKTAPGVWDDVITERSYRGDVVRNAKGIEAGNKVNDDISVDVTVSIVADEYASENVFAIRYVRWAGSLWKVANVEVQRPRFNLRLGGAYNGPTPAAEPADAP